MIRLSLPFPPSVWDMYVGWGKTRRLSPEYTKWRGDAGVFMRGRNEKPVSTPFCISICLKRPNKRQDLDNRIKPILDALQFYGIIKNDNLCERVTATWDHGMREECVVLVMPAEEAMAA
jgi:crossover junction endodeoxyribonuclease RusA